MNNVIHQLQSPFLYSLLLGIITVTTVLPSNAQDRWVAYKKADGSTAQLLASADTDGDGIDNELEINGYVFDLGSGSILPWDGDTSKRYFFTDPLRASTDGDPYSDFMEATGANMPGSIEAPYNHPLVAARPIIAVYMTDYEVILNGEITDEQGGSRTESFTNQTSNEDQFGVGVTVGVDLNPLSLASVEAEYNYSFTQSFTQSSTFTDEFNWNSARSVNEAEAARLRLNVYYVNLGSAPASNVRPTFSLRIGNKVIATFQSSLNSEAQSLAPGARFPANGAIAIDSYVAGEVDRDIVISLEELKALQRGAPLSIVVPQVEANILRWDESTQSFSNEITWADYEQDIDPVSITLDTNIGGKSVQYQVYTGSPQYQPEVPTLRQVFDLVFDVEERGNTLFIEDSAYPDSWYFATDSDEIQEAREDQGEGGDMLDVPAYRGNRIVMLSPGSSASPEVDFATFSRDLAYVFASARPINGLPVSRAVATLYQAERVIEVPMEANPQSAFLTNAEPIDEMFYGGFVTIFNARGEARVEELASPGQINRYQSCLDVPEATYGRVGIPMSGDLSTLFSMGCVGSDEVPWTEVGEGLQGVRFTRAVHVVNRDIALRATQTPGEGAIQRSIDGGRTWATPSRPITKVSGNSLNAFIQAFDFIDEQKGFAVGSDGGIWRTDDAGDTWSIVPQGFTDAGLNSVDFYDERNGLIAGSSGTLLRTTDGGENWTPITVNAPGTSVNNYGRVSFVDVQYINLETIALSAFDAVLMSYDGGAFWEINAVPELTPNEDCISTARALQFPTRTTGYFLGCADESSFFKTVDGGRSWSKVLVPGEFSFFNMHFFDAQNGIFTGREIFHTTDGGQTWIEQQASSRPNDIYRSIHFHDGLGILAGDDIEDTFSFVLHTRLVSDDLTVGPEGMAFSIRPNPVLRFDGDPTVINGASSIDEAAEALSQYDYVILGDTELRNSNSIELSRLIAHPDMSETVVFVGVDLGVTTENLQGTDLAFAMISWSHIFLTNMGPEYGVTRARQNEALDWANQRNIPVLLDADPEYLFYDDVDATFNPNGTALDIRPYHFYFLDNYMVDQGAYVDQASWRTLTDEALAYQETTDIRILASTSTVMGGSYEANAFHFAWHGALLDGLEGIGWGEPGYAADTGQAPYREQPEIEPGRAYFSDASFSGSIARRQTENGEVSLDFSNNTYRFGLSTAPVHVEDDVTEALPQEVVLHQNYPNPFTSTTTIPFEVHEPTDVRIDVFDILGRHVARLVDGVVIAGKHLVTMDSGRLSSGTYLYRIQAGETRKIRRMVYVK